MSLICLGIVGVYLKTVNLFEVGICLEFLWFFGFFAIVGSAKSYGCSVFSQKFGVLVEALRGRV